MKPVWRIAWKELVQVFRDRKLVFSTLVLPVLLMPVFMFGPSLFLSRLLEGTSAKVQEVAVAGLPQEALEALLKANLAPKPVEDPEKAVREGKYPVGVVYEGGRYRVFGCLAGGVSESQVAVGKVQAALQGLKERKVAEALAAKGISLDLLHPFQVETVDASPPREKAGGFWASSSPSSWWSSSSPGGRWWRWMPPRGRRRRGPSRPSSPPPFPFSTWPWARLWPR
jgi:sodium transport system permease protein